MTENTGTMTQPSWKERVDLWVDAHREEMLEDLKTLIRIPSVKSAPEEGMPYGKMAAQAVLAMQGMMERCGLRTVNYENHCVAGDLDVSQEKTLDILAHLDVVPVSDTWKKTAPFEPLIEGDRIYGRGTSDDKGPAVAALYAVRCVRELGLPLKHGVRLICGSDEENGSDDLRYYYAREKEALYTFSPDADYPLINIEKGRLEKEFRGRGSIAGSRADGIHVLEIRAGDTFNIAPGRGEVRLALNGVPQDVVRKAADQTSEITGGSFDLRTEGEKAWIVADGRAAHAASPQAGINAATMILTLLKHLPLVSDDRTQALYRIADLWPHGCFNGQGLGVNASDEESGELTMSLDILTLETDADSQTFRVEGTFDCRAPLCCNDDNLTKKVRERLREAGFEMEEGAMTPAHYVSADSELVKKLLESYELYFGKKGEPLAIGGGTYVHELKRGVAFGCAVPEVDNRMHGDDEFMEIPMLLLSTKIFADAILRLCS